MKRRSHDTDRRIPSEFLEGLKAAFGTGSITSKSEVHDLKLRLCRRYHLPSVPADPDILEMLTGTDRERFEDYLRLKPMRTASGVSPVAVMTSPEDCPHGVCLYCPGGVGNGSPQSYTGQEPAALRAGQHGFDPYHQTASRIRQYHEIGHPTDKIDLIVMGGTFTSRPIEYQNSFILGCFNALNKGRRSRDLMAAHRRNETAPHRCIGLTIETRPDHCTEAEIRQILGLGGTRVELGVQTMDDHILKRVNRGHTSLESRQATKLAKDFGMKVGYHMMPGLPGSSSQKDLESFREVFEDEGYRPDMLKLYPTLVVRGTELYDMWERGEYEPLSTDDAVKLLAEVKKIVPGFVRIQRIQRDIPAKLIEAGVRKSNLRQLVHQAMEREGERCGCIRCREAGHTKRRAEGIELLEMTYRASGGIEHFLSYEDPVNDVLVAFLRLRFPSEGSACERKGRAIVRELRVSGLEVPIGKRSEERYQHTGYGRKLLERAEEITKEDGWTRLIITSGVGVRPYYRRFGYRRSGPYMLKVLK